MNFASVLAFVSTCALLLTVNTITGEAFRDSSSRLSDRREARDSFKNHGFSSNRSCRIVRGSLPRITTSSEAVRSRTVNLSDPGIVLPLKRGIPFVLTSSACENASTPLHTCGIHPKTDPFASTRWSSCAVVGNGRSLLASGIGQEIDAHDAVFRINIAPVLGFQDDVGSKATVRFAFPPICGSIAGHTFEDTHICIFAGRGAKFYNAYLQMRNSFFLVHSRRALERRYMNLTSPDFKGFFASSRDFDTLQHSAGLDLHPTTGLLALLFAMSTCDHVSVYGFTAGLIKNQPSNRVAHISTHYFDDKDVLNLAAKDHKFDKEGDFLASAHKNKFIYHWDAEISRSAPLAGVLV